MFIIATISINSYTADKIEEIIEAGATVLRYNFSHGTPSEMLEKVGVARNVIKKLGVEDEVKVLADLPGAKIRLGGADADSLTVKCGDVVRFKSASFTKDMTDFIPVDYPSIGEMVTAGQKISLGDGEIGFEVVSIINSDEFTAVVLNDWHIPPMKAINIGLGIDSINHITEKTIEHIKHIANINPDIVAFSFVNSLDVIKELKGLLYKAMPKYRGRIMAKIETQDGITNLPEIVQEVDMILVARGDLGLSMPIEKLGVSQKIIIKVSKKFGKIVVVATQILDSVLDRFVPARAEILDLTNIVLDGADGIMLAKETGVSKTPGRSVTLAKNIIEEASVYNTNNA